MVCNKTPSVRYLSSYYSEKTTAEVPKLAEDGYEAAPTVVAVADVFIDNRGFFWNGQVSDELTVERRSRWPRYIGQRCAVPRHLEPIRVVPT